MKVVFVNRFFHPDESATSQLLCDLAFDLAEQGWDVHVVASRMRHEDPAARLAPEQVVRGVHVHRTTTSRFGRGNLLGRAVDSVSFHVSAGVRLLRLLGRGDIVVAKTDPPMISVIAAWACRLRGAVLVNWLQDVFPEVAERLGVRAARGLPGRLLRGLRDRSLRQAAANVALGEGMARYLRERIPGRADTVQVIENWSDGTRVHPVDAKANPLRKAWGLDDRFVVAYSGNHGRVHEFETVLDAFERLRDAPRIALLFIGSGPRRAGVEDEVRRRALSAVHFQPMQPREQLSESLSVGDVHLVILKPELEGLVVPSKVYGVAAAGRAAIFIGDARGEAARILEREGSGFTVPEGDGAGLAGLIRRLESDLAEVAAMGRRARAVFEARHDRRVAVGRWIALLENVASTTRG